MEESYNYHLYRIRREQGLSRWKFSKKIHINFFIYLLLENGYIKPTKKSVEKISVALEEDYTPYLDQESSYPVELPDKEQMKIVKWFYNLIGKLWVHIVLGVLWLVSLGALITGLAMDYRTENNKDAFFAPEFVKFQTQLREVGTTTLSLTDEAIRPEIYVQRDITYDIPVKYKDLTNPDVAAEYNNDEVIHELANVIGSYMDYDHIAFRYTIHTDNFRMTVHTYNVISDVVRLKVEVYDYNSDASFSGHYEEVTPGIFVPVRFETEDITDLVQGISITEEQGAMSTMEFDKTSYGQFLRYGVEKFHPTIDELIEDKIGTYSSLEMIKLHAAGDREFLFMSSIALVMFLGGVIFTAVFTFALFYCFFYSSKRKVKFASKLRTLDGTTSAYTTEPHLKTDWKVGPFIPETLFEIAGIILVFIGATRIVYYFLMIFFGLVSLDSAQEANKGLLTTFVVGMFLLYFIDFDTFLDDERVIRNIVIYSIVFLVIYLIEVIFFTSFNDGSVLGETLSQIKPVNNFGTITCYFWIMLFLYFTPRNIKTKRGALIWRLMVLIPIAIIVTTTIINQGWKNWGWDLDPVVSFLLLAERPQFSLLCVVYLVTFYFLRLWIRKKYGEEKAILIFQSNRFLWYKNILTASLLLIIGFGELMASHNGIASIYGFGQYWPIIFLAPALLFYHPHKGPRNRILDITTTLAYGIALMGGFIQIAGFFFI